MSRVNDMLLVVLAVVVVISLIAVLLKDLVACYSSRQKIAENCKLSATAEDLLPSVQPRSSLLFVTDKGYCST